MKINIIKTANGKFWPADEEAELKVKKLKVADVYTADIFNRNGVNFEIVALSLKYESMPDDKRQVFYKKITQAALDNIFNDGADDNVINQLLSWF